ncbi:MAG: aminoacyl-tRNA hydrolase [Mycoplasma sp.]|nr:aminoacyl-tRNA hydrolase [Mycoplasma sp.]
MKLIVGLGNPGLEYERTRHNVGFLVIDEIAKKLNVKLSKERFDSMFYINEDFILMKPNTFMNLSGEAVKKAMDFFKILSKDILIIHDDLDIKIGQAKIKISNSSGGHNGVKNIIEKINTAEFYRLKIGIGRPEKNETSISSYVLGDFTNEQYDIISKVVEQSAEAVISIIYNGIHYVTNNFNKKKE